MTARTHSQGSGAVAAVALVWLGLAVALGASGRLQTLRPPLPQAMLVVLTAAVLVAGRLVPPLRAWTRTVDLRVLVALHVTRFVGVYFLILYGRGELPYAFAVPGGWGDISVAGLALLLVASGPPNSIVRRRAYILWNAIGFVDILFVVATAARLGIADPASMAALLRLPLSLLPTYLVPLVIASHLLIASRLKSDSHALRPRVAA